MPAVSYASDKEKLAALLYSWHIVGLRTKTSIRQKGAWYVASIKFF
jgi:hypothetical protein